MQIQNYQLDRSSNWTYTLYFQSISIFQVSIVNDFMSIVGPISGSQQYQGLGFVLQTLELLHGLLIGSLPLDIYNIYECKYRTTNLIDHKTRHVHDIFSRVLSLSVHRQWFYESCGIDKWYVVLRSNSCFKHYGYYMVFSLVLFHQIFIESINANLKLPT